MKILRAWVTGFLWMQMSQCPFMFTCVFACFSHVHRHAAAPPCCCMFIQYRRKCVNVSVSVHLWMCVCQWGSESSRLIPSQSPAEQMWGLICQWIRLLLMCWCVCEAENRSKNITKWGLLWMLCIYLISSACLRVFVSLLVFYFSLLAIFTYIFASLDLCTLCEFQQM